MKITKENSAERKFEDKMDVIYNFITGLSCFFLTVVFIAVKILNIVDIAWWSFIIPIIVYYVFHAENVYFKKKE